MDFMTAVTGCRSDEWGLNGLSYRQLSQGNLSLMAENVVIVGAGLSGSLLAIYFAKRGINCDVYESRSDMRKISMSAGRSINLALSNRGIRALREVGLDEYMLSEAVPMHGRMIHATDGSLKLMPYSGRHGEYINSVSRGGLNIALLNEAEKYTEVRFHFNQECVDFDCDSGEARFSSGKTVKGDTLIATDGAGSAVRNAMLHGGVPHFNFSARWLDHGYKELHIPPTADGFALEKNALHIWPRDKFMMIALPNFDGSFTCTLFVAHKGENSFEKIDSGDYRETGDPHESARLFMETNFGDAVPLMPGYVHDFFENPTGNLGTIKCFPWNARGKALLIGDAAHAVVPFYGQGMNCSFEDCRVLNELVGEIGTDWEKVFNRYSELRKENTDAIADMAEENFYEMRDAVADPVFLRKRELETKLEQTFPEYFSKYSMVTFREDLPYATAKRLGNAQDAMLMQLCADIPDVSALNIDEVMNKVSELHRK